MQKNPNISSHYGFIFPAHKLSQIPPLTVNVARNKSYIINFGQEPILTEHRQTRLVCNECTTFSIINVARFYILIPQKILYRKYQNTILIYIPTCFSGNLGNGLFTLVHVVITTSISILRHDLVRGPWWRSGNTLASHL